MTHINYFFNDIAERDMDFLLIEEFASTSEFLKLFTDIIEVGDAYVESLYVSKTDAQLGESDLTVVINAQGIKIGLLIEDKIDANAMQNQAGRYYKRGEKGVQNGEYDRFYTFIIAPQKYLDTNNEAKKYQHRVSYVYIPLQLITFHGQLDHLSRTNRSPVTDIQITCHGEVISGSSLSYNDRRHTVV